MKLVTFQSMNALKSLIINGYLECDEKYVNTQKMGTVYEWVLEKMNEAVENTTNAKYPLWVWVKCYNSICPPKHRGESVKGFDVKITFHKSPEEVFITDYRRYSFLLNNTYIPENQKDKEDFERKLNKRNITQEELKAYIRKDKFAEHRMDVEFLNICKEIRKSFDRCITTESDVLQGCVWRIDLEDVESIEILSDRNYRYGSLNYIKSNGERKDWIAEFYQGLN